MTFATPDLVLLVEIALVLALVATTAYALVLRREFRRFKTYNADYARLLAETGRAMEGVERAVDGVQREGADVLAALSRRIEEARAIAERLESAQGRAALRETAIRETPAGRSAHDETTLAAALVGSARTRETPPPFEPRPDAKPKAYAWPTVVVKRISDDA